MNRRITALASVATAATVATVGMIAACGSSATGPSAASSSTASSAAPSSAAPSSAGPSGVSGTITVLAAASLTEAFKTLGQQFEFRYPAAKVTFSFAASSALALQINGGAKADVFASASPKNMKQVITAGGAAASTNFVKNVMEIAVPPGNPAKITSLADLTKQGVKLALCQPQVPCGATAALVFKNAKLTARPVTAEADVKSTLTKVESGEVDAGVVYVTDVRAAGSKVKGVSIPAGVNASTQYPIAALSKAPNAPGAKAFVDYVLSPAGQQTLAADGFEKP